MPNVGSDPAVAVEELDGSPIESLEDGLFTAKMILLCDWEDRFDLINNLTKLGGFPYPHDDTWGATCRSATVEKYKSEKTTANLEEWAAYEKAKCTAHFSSPTWDQPLFVGGTIETTEEILPAVEGVQLDHRFFQWTATPGTPLKAGEAPIKPLYFAEYQKTHHNIYTSSIGTSYTTLAEALALVDSVNDASVNAKVLPGLTFAAGTLLMKPPVIRRKGYWTDIIYRMGWNKMGWNKFWNGATQEWQSIYIRDADPAEQYFNFPEEDWSSL